MLILLIHILRSLLTLCSSAGRGVVRRGFGDFHQQSVRIPVESDRPGSRRSVRTADWCVQGLTLTFLFLLTLFASHAYAYDVDNSARVDAVITATPTVIISNTVTVDAVPPPSVASAEFLRLTPDPVGGTLAVTDYSNSDPPVILPPDSFQPILPVPGPGNLGAAAGYNEGEMIVFRVTDPDQNLDPSAIDITFVRIEVPMSGDSEFLRLYEESNNSGTFVGYIYSGTNATVQNDGDLTAPNGSIIDLTYDDSGTPLITSAPVTAGGGLLWLQLSTTRQVVGAGDFTPYSVSVENVDAVRLAPGVEITQILPTGFTYQSGTTYLDGAPAPDPTIGTDGRTLVFAIGDMPPGSTAAIDFVASVATANPGRYPSSAIADDTAGVLSNQAEVTVLIRDDLFTNRAFLAGRVVQLEQCGEPETAVGVSNVRIFLEDGTFVLTDSEGRYHVEGLKPGTHVVQLDPITIPGHLKPVLCDDHTRFANTPSSRFVDLQGGTLWQADFYLADNVTKGEVSIRLDNRFGTGNTAIYSVELTGQEVETHNLELNVTIPFGVEYIPGSSTDLNGPIIEPTITGNQLTYRLSDPSGDWTNLIEFHVNINGDKITREMLARASLTFDTFNEAGISTAESESAMIWIDHGERQEIEEYLLRPHFDTLNADLGQDDINKLDKIVDQISQLEIKHIIISGHTDARRILWREGIAYKDNFELSEARARAIADRLADGLDLDPDKIVVIGHAATVPIADNDTDEGRYLNRRTELKIYHLKRYPIVSEAIDTKNGDLHKVPIEFRPVKPPPPPPKPEEGILSLSDGQKLAHNIETVRVRLDARLTPLLLLDGEEISASRIGFTLAEEDNGTKLLSYVGIDFGEPGRHTLQLKGIGPFGNARIDQTVNIIRTGPVARLEIADLSGNIADGRTPISIQMKLYDAAGELIEAESKLELRGGFLIPYQSEVNRLPRTPETGMVNVDSNGIALFNPVNQSGRYPIVLGFGESEVELEIHVKPEQREWILVGLGDGTVGYNSISGNIQSLPDSVDEDFYSEGRVAFFARGQIKGEWLMTLSYDSDKDDLKDRSLHQIIDPDRYYTLYGDSSAQGYTAASSEKLYVRVEKDRFYAVYGDYDTGLNTTELSRYSRSMTGLKSEYIGTNYGYNAFAAETEQAFIRDEIRGDGTSGLYRLSRQDIVINSDKIVIEVRDRYHSERIIETRSLQRHIDYNIDFDGGTLYFKEPIVSRDQNFNPVYIVVDYETFDNSGSEYQYGGRAYLRNNKGTVEVGATLIHEGHSGIESDLYGADVTWHISPRTSLRGEYATSDTTLPNSSVAGDAWLAELRHTELRYDMMAYIREQQPGFGLGQQNASESGSRKYGAEATWRFNKQLSIMGDAFRQDNLVSDANRTAASASMIYAERQYLLTGGLRYVNDNLATGESHTSNQLVLGADWYATHKLTLRARHEQSVGGSMSSDYPTRTLLGADYVLNRMVTGFAEQEFTFGDNADTASSRVGLRATPWNGFQARTSVEQRIIEESRRVFANLGLTQTWQITPWWSADISLDRSQVVSGAVESPIYPNVPPASGSNESFTAVSLGSNLRKHAWMWDNRIEYRTSDTEDHWGLNSGYMIEPRSGLGLSLGLYLTQKNRKLSGDRTSGDLRLGLAWRPFHGRSIILDRLDLISEKDSGASSEFDSWRIINRLKGHWRLTHQLNMALQYGSKYVQETINDLQLSGYTDSFGAEFRYDLTRKWDIGLHAATLHQWEASQLSYRTGISLGYSPVTNLWISLGYNLSGFTDKDLSGSDHTAQGAFLQFRFKFDQNSVKDALSWLDRS